MKAFLNIARHGHCQKILVAVIAATSLSSESAIAASYAPWLTQIGVTDSVMSAANWGKGQLLGVVDTGIVINNSAFAAGQVSSTLSSCAAVTFNCPKNGFADDNGHGTAVAEIAAGYMASKFTVNYGGYKTSLGNVISVAPDANILSEKVLNAQGSAYSTDVANGVKKAADAGASVINVSITYGNTTDVVSAINYAAAKGAFIVWAGGNDGNTLLSGANTSGLTTAAVNHLILAGSVNSKNGLSSFSNTPGLGSLVDTSNNKSGYSARWAMAPGEYILAPDTSYSSSSWALWSGTSMSTPIISGSLLLLQSAWPILKTNGTAANLLLATSVDLGAKGVDSTYGNGLVNLTTAFQPYGALMVTQANGKAIAVSDLTGSLISSGALGNLSAVQSKLASYTSLDSYQRNFTVNLSAMIKSSTAATINPLPTNVNTGPAKIKLADGSEMAYALSAAPNKADSPGALALNSESAGVSRSGYAMRTDTQGTTMAFGYGSIVPVQYSYTKALYGSDDAALAASALSTHLSALSQGGALAAYGTQWGSNIRVAVAYNGTAATDPTAFGQGVSWANPDAASVGAGITYKVNDTLQLGFSFQSLKENHGLLGSVYASSSQLSLGDNHSNEIGVSTVANINHNNSVYLEASQATTQAAGAVDRSMFAGTTKIRSQSFGMSYMSKDLFRAEDKLMLSVKQPLRVTSGSANLAMTNIDPVTGVPTTGVQSISLVPEGREIDYKVAYDTPLSKTRKLGLDAGYMRDALNMAGNNHATIGMNWSVKF